MCRKNSSLPVSVVGSEGSSTEAANEASCLESWSVLEPMIAMDKIIIEVVVSLRW